MSSRSCCIDTCSCKINSCQLFRFPGYEDMRKIWLDLVQPHSPNVSDINAPRICGHHFEDKYLRGRRRQCLACPTLFSPKEIETRTPDNPVCLSFFDQYAVPITTNYDQSSVANTELTECLIKVKHDHTYAKSNTLICHPPISLYQTLKPEVPKDALPSLGISRIAEEVASTSGTTTTIHEESPVGSTNSGTCHPPISLYQTLKPEVPKDAPPSLGISRIAEKVASTSGTTTTIHEESPVGSTNSGTCLTKTGRQRIVQSVQKLTPKCKRLYNKCLDIMKSKKRLAFGCEKKIKELKRLCDKSSFDSLIEGMTPEAKSFLQMQINQYNKHIKRRRFTNEEKIFALSMMKQSPKGYRFLRKLFVLPSKVTLNKFTKDMSLTSGLNPKLLAHLQDMISSWADIKKLCSIVFDEVALTPHLNYVESYDEIEGFVNFGQNKERKLCDHALVVMLRGVCTSWTQPIAYYMCEGATPAFVLKNILRDVVDAAVKIGLKPIAVICDQGSTFLSCTKSFQDETRRQNLLNDAHEDNKIDINGHKLNIIYDPPHLIKGIRNNFLNKDIVFCGKLARWHDIMEVYKADCELGGIRLLHKLTDEHVIPAKIKKMKVKNCTQVLSERTSAMLQYTSRYENHADGTLVSPTMKNTAEAVLFFDKLFDSVNGSRGGAAPGKMRGPVKLDKTGQLADTAICSSRPAGPVEIVSSMTLSQQVQRAVIPLFSVSDQLADNAGCSKSSAEPVETVPILFQQVRRERMRAQASAFTAGYVTRKLLKKIKCQTCKRLFLTTDISDIHDWITLRERRALRGPNLCYPTAKFIRLFRELIGVINEYLECFPHNPHIVKNIRDIFLRNAVVDWFGCQQHHVQSLNFFISLVCRLQIHNWCNSINRILKGSDIERLSSSNMTTMQSLAFKKFKAIRCKK